MFLRQLILIGLLFMQGCNSSRGPASPSAVLIPDVASEAPQVVPAAETPKPTLQKTMPCKHNDPSDLDGGITGTGHEGCLSTGSELQQ
ncbi:MAG: hypothetical protein HN790_18195 [Methylococcales bacterium]|jgi:hypothetical protein|nr:hypothetical protein [Methylococcales bacterium]